MEEVVLRVAEALRRDVGRGIARIDPKVLNEMGWETGDVVEIIGKRRTCALIWPARPED